MIDLALISCGLEYSDVLEEVERLAQKLGARLVVPTVDTDEINAAAEAMGLTPVSNDLKLMLAEAKTVADGGTKADGVFVATCFRCAEGAITRNAVTKYLQRNTELPIVTSSFTERTKADTLLLRLEALVNVIERKSLLARRVQTGLTGGIDSGSSMTKAAIMKDNEVAGVGWVRTGGDVVASAEKALRTALEQADTKRASLDAIGATGYGRGPVGRHFKADLVQEEITVCAKGASFLAGVQSGEATIVDIGGMDNKATTLYNGIPVSFTVGSICAGSSGKFLESCSQRLGVDVLELGRMALRGNHERIRMNAYCIVFGMQDLVSSIGAGAKPEDVASAACFSVAEQFYEQHLQEISVVEPVIQVGGTSKIEGLVQAMKETLGLDVIVPRLSQYTGAIGAALLVSGLVESGERVRKPV
jgi:putative methanogenesis marker protein 15